MLQGLPSSGLFFTASVCWHNEYYILKTQCCDINILGAIQWMWESWLNMYHYTK